MISKNHTIQYERNSLPFNFVTFWQEKIADRNAPQNLSWLWKHFTKLDLLLKLSENTWFQNWKERSAKCYLISFIQQGVVAASNHDEDMEDGGVVGSHQMAHSTQENTTAFQNANWGRIRNIIYWPGKQDSMVPTEKCTFKIVPLSVLQQHI